MAARSADDIRRELRDLDAQRKAMEEEVSMLSEKLNAPGQPGLKGSLLDKEGFPRSDIDVAQVRRDRHRLICLSNDHRALSDKLAGLLAQLHAATRGSGGRSDVPAGSATSAEREATGAAAGPAPAAGPALVPFALIDEVTDGSPASLAGLQVGDLLCAFGDVTAAPAPNGDAAASANGGASASGSTAATAAAGEGGVLQRVAATLASSEGRAVPTTVLRRGAPLFLSLVPQRWAGRGLLGCHLQPL
ncbi:hypothetical protein GPECTOR_16g610 [Gonium pectorale]|uniref:Nas2 N-terminal domain-containing protein n=1 Tax=Gonium pectorale TaxID=33097 RepID=A0A150GKQ6_GONPE|nr:hypothetical protein GPECTOR_16g610 [Gonium pectorale]|eukprot:KXZ50436.1 hypothetical protein GPECTOR_16g610 [Gonium pectorale]